MSENEWLAEQFEEKRGHLRAVAYRMLGSVSEADDAVQEAWLRLSRSDAEAIDNLGGWLTTVTARVCLDMLRSRKSRREEPMEPAEREPASQTQHGDPEQEAMLADSVGVALLVVLDRLAPAERLAFVLHDLFAIPFEEIGEMVGRSAMAARQLASRARRRVQGSPIVDRSDLNAHRQIVEKFRMALRSGDVEGLVAVLDPEFAIRADWAALPPGSPREVHGARAWAKQAVEFYKGAKFTATALVDGVVGVVIAPHGRLLRVLRFTITEGKIAEIEVVADAQRLAGLNLAVLEK